MIEKPLIWQGGRGLASDNAIRRGRVQGDGYVDIVRLSDDVGPIPCRCGCGLVVPASEARWGVRYYSTAHQTKAQTERAKLRNQAKTARAAKRV